MPELAIETKALSWAFEKKRPILKDLSLQVPEHSIYGFLGPNGAGKTTTIRLLSGMLIAEQEAVFIHGQSLTKNIPGIFKNIGFLIETPSLYLHLTGKENLAIITTLRGIPKKNIDHMLKLVGLEQAANKKVRAYSLGMKQRLGIAMALLPEPGLLLLDEPVNGLDPNGMIEIRELLIDLNKKEGKTIFLSSHLLHEVEKLCTHIGIINQGELKYQGTMEEMKRSAYESGEVIFKIPKASEYLSSIQEMESQAKQISADEILLPFTTPNDVSEFNKQITRNNIPVHGIRISGGLEEWFMQVIQSSNKTNAL
jgi:lantibiotic transport system ATP-binding protein